MGPIRDYFVVRETTQRKQRKKAPNTVEPDRFFSHKRILNSSGNGVVLILCLYLKDGDVAPDLGKEAEDPGLGGLSNSGTPPFGRLLKCIIIRSDTEI